MQEKTKDTFPLNIGFALFYWKFELFLELLQTIFQSHFFLRRMEKSESCNVK